MNLKFSLIFFIIYLSKIFTKIQVSEKLLQTSNDKAGVKIALKQDLILDFQKKYLPKLISKIGQISIPDQKIDVDIKIGTLHIYLTEINFSITNISVDKIFVNFKEPNIVQISANEITGNGSLRTRFKLGFISETDRVNVNVNRLDITVTTGLSSIESKKTPGKLIPSAAISDININLDFDFSIHGSLIAKVASLVKGLIKNLINSKLQDSLKGSIKNALNDIISENVNNLPVFIPINKFDLSVDYSLVSNPKIIQNRLILNSYGTIVNLKKPESMDYPYILPDNLPDFDSQGKLAQVFFSDFSLKTALKTLHLTEILQVTIDSNEIPKDSPIQFNTTSLDLLINGFIDLYGEDKLVKFDCRTFNNSPSLEILDNEINADLEGLCSIFVEVIDPLTNNTFFDKAIDFTTLVHGKVSANLMEGGVITAEIQGLNLSNTQFVYSKIPKADAKRFEELVNFSSRLIVPFLNKKYLKDLSVNIPSFDGIYFDDSKLDIMRNYIKIQLTPKVTLEK